MVGFVVQPDREDRGRGDADEVDGPVVVFEPDNEAEWAGEPARAERAECGSEPGAGVQREHQVPVRAEEQAAGAEDGGQPLLQVQGGGVPPVRDRVPGQPEVPGLRVDRRRDAREGAREAQGGAAGVRGAEELREHQRGAGTTSRPRAQGGQNRLHSQHARQNTLRGRGQQDA